MGSLAASYAQCRKQVSCPGYVAHELSGFIASIEEAIDEPGDMATGPQDAEVSGCFEPLGAQGAVGDGGRRAFGMLGAQFRRYRRRYEEDGFAGLADRRLGKASMRRVPVDKLVWMLGEYRTHHLGWNVKHFHEHIRQQHGFRLGYTWTKTQLHTAGLVERAARRGAHRRKRPRKPC